MTALLYPTRLAIVEPYKAELLVFYLYMALETTCCAARHSEIHAPLSPSSATGTLQLKGNRKPLVMG